jgi:hypothetical protein
MRKIHAIITGVSVVVIVIVIVTGVNANSLLRDILTTQRESIVDATIVVPPLEFVYYPVTPPSGSNDCKIQGTFSARGGNDDIRVFIVDQFGFNSLKNGETFNAYFSTPQQVGGNIDVNVPCDKTIYLVYDNSFSIITSKTVTVKAYFEYVQ